MRYVLAMLVLYAAPLAAQQQPSPWGLVARALGKTGAPPGETYRATFPRSDLRVRVGDVAIAPALALTSWAAFAGSADSADVMGDLVLTERRAPPPLPSTPPPSSPRWARTAAWRGTSPRSACRRRAARSCSTAAPCPVRSASTRRSTSRVSPPVAP